MIKILEEYILNIDISEIYLTVLQSGLNDYGFKVWDLATETCCHKEAFEK